MDFVLTWLEPLIRWLHVVAGVLWIGHLYFFNWVNAQVAKTYDADSKKKVVPELMPRALYFFRWGAAYTWISGILMLMVLYWHPFKSMMADESGNASAAVGAAMGAVLVGVFLYDALWKAMAKNENAGIAVSVVLLAGLLLGFKYGLGMAPRALFIHVGAMFGTFMAFNVWYRIWPSQRKIVTAIRDGQAPDAAVVALAGLRSKQNTYMSVPLIFTMVSNHYPTSYLTFMDDLGWVMLLLVILGGWGVTKMIFNKSATAAPKTI